MQKLDELKKLFPEAVTDGKMNLDRLKEFLGDHVHVESCKEKYEFSWYGKSQAIHLSQTPSTGTLRPDKASSKHWDTTENLYIEGDNLEVLKLLQKTYFGKIKMIYIDPPYNTGNDFVYKDNFSNTIRNYQALTGQTANANIESNGRFHMDWLNMMYPRLRLARNLLSDDGVIFISIDDHEVHNLRKMCDDIFGEMNFIAEIVWQKVHTRKNSARYFSNSHEYILCYAKVKKIDIGDVGWERNLLPRESTDAYKNPDQDPKGLWKPDPITAHNYYSADYKITKPNGVILSRPQDRYWALSEENWLKKVKENAVVWGEGDAYPMVKRYLNEVQDGLVPVTLFDRKFAGDTALANKEIKQLFEQGAIFPYPKPSKLIKRLLQIATDENSLILDFFSGSSTTAHAVMQLNAEDGGNRKYIMVQLPELLKQESEAFKAGFQSICEIGKERIRRAGERIVLDTGKMDLDIGFKVFKFEQNFFDLQDN